MGCQNTRNGIHGISFTIVMVVPFLHQAGGVLDPNAQLKLADFTGKSGCEKLVQAMGSVAPTAKAKARGRAGTGGAPETSEARIWNRLVLGLQTVRLKFRISEWSCVLEPYIDTQTIFTGFALVSSSPFSKMPSI